MKSQYTRTNCFEKVTSQTVEKFRTILKKGVEFYGFLDDEGKMVDVRLGHPTSVEAEIIPKSDCEWHSHPKRVADIGQIAGLTTEQAEQVKCAVDSERLRTSIISDADAFIAFLRPWTVPPNGDQRVTSMIAMDEGLLQYYLADAQKWTAFRQEVDAKYGKNTEIDLQTALAIETSKIMNEALDEVYERQQDFSYCGDKKIWENLKQKWHAYLQEKTGLAIDFWQPPNWKPAEPPKQPLETLGQILKQMLGSVSSLVSMESATKPKSVFNSVLSR